MKTRIIHTKIHFEDDWFNTLSIGYRYLFIYLFTNTHIGQTGAYNLSKRVALLETGASSEEWDNACREFEKAKKVKFIDEWIIVLNSKKYANYSGSKNEKAFSTEFNSLPQEIKDTVSILYDTPINNKSYIKDNKSEDIAEDFVKFQEGKA